MNKKKPFNIFKIIEAVTIKIEFLLHSELLFSATPAQWTECHSWWIQRFNLPNSLHQLGILCPPCHTWYTPTWLSSLTSQSEAWTILVLHWLAGLTDQISMCTLLCWCSPWGWGACPGVEPGGRACGRSWTWSLYIPWTCKWAALL